MTNEVDVAMLGRIGTGQADGWVVSGIDSYADVPGVRLNQMGDQLISPDFGTRIEQFVVRVKSSSRDGRRLVFIPWRDGFFDTTLQIGCDYSTNKDTYVLQVLSAADRGDFSRFKITLDAGGGSTGWGLRELSVVTAQKPVPPAPVPVWDGESVSLGSCQRDDRTYVFSPDFSALATIGGEMAIAGAVSNVFCVVRTDRERETAIRRNEGGTQYQGHYVWMTETTLPGLGTYTAASTERSFGWIFRNDTGKELEVTSLDVTYGQWGARNSQVDSLAFAWRLAPRDADFSDEDGWHEESSESYLSPHVEGDGFSGFPVFEERTIRAACVRIPSDRSLAVRWRDRCPPVGKNAALGLAAVSLRARDARRSLKVIVR